MTGFKRCGQERGEVPPHATWGHWRPKESPSIFPLAVKDLSLLSPQVVVI